MLSHRSRLVNVANRSLSALWKANILTTPELDAEYLCAHAQNKTRLSNFGDDWFQGPLKCLVEALREEALLNPLGRLAAFGQLEKVLRERLWTEHWLSSHPEIEQRSLLKPVIVVGPMRSGTTRLHRLLAADTRLSHLRFFETIFPTPAPCAHRTDKDKRRAKAAVILAALHCLNPTTAVIHPTGSLEPEEELGLLVASIWGMKHEAQWHVPTYGRWSEGQDATPAYLHLARLLRLVGWMRGEDDSRPWVLKTPQHTLDLPALRRVFPDARFIFTHREPEALVGSSCSLAWNQMIIHSDHVDPKDVGSAWLHKTALQVERMLDARELIPESQRIDIRYADMDRDWCAVMARVYGFLDMDIAPALPAMARYVADAERKRNDHLHCYHLAAFGLDGGKVSEQFEGYMQTFELALSKQTHRLAAQQCWGRGGDASPSQAGQPVPLFQLLAGGDPLRDFDVRPLPAVATERRGSAPRARDRPMSRDSAPVVEQIWPAVCRGYPPSAGKPDARVPTLEMAPRRSLCEDQGRDALSLAGGGSRGRDHREVRDENPL